MVAILAVISMAYLIFQPKHMKAITFLFPGRPLSILCGFAVATIVAWTGLSLIPTAEAHFDSSPQHSRTMS
jgi:hypothetical protein